MADEVARKDQFTLRTNSAIKSLIHNLLQSLLTTRRGGKMNI